MLVEILTSILIGILLGLALFVIFGLKPKKKMKQPKMPHKCCGKCKFNIENIPQDEYSAFRELFSNDIGGKTK